MTRIGDRPRSPAAWVALLAISLQALWPLIVQAKPRSVTLVPVCTVAGETHYVELETGGGAPSHEEHCKACPVAAAALASVASPFVSPDIAFSIPAGKSSPVASRRVSHAQSRAPPPLLFAGMESDNQERNDEEAFALGHRGARDAVAGRGVLRRGVLLG
jgi:hypothetical protein